MTYGNKRDYPKIDLFDSAGKYLGTTTWAKTLLETGTDCLRLRAKLRRASNKHALNQTMLDLASDYSFSGDNANDTM